MCGDISREQFESYNSLEVKLGELLKKKKKEQFTFPLFDKDMMLFRK